LKNKKKEYHKDIPLFFSKLEKNRKMWYNICTIEGEWL